MRILRTGFFLAAACVFAGCAPEGESRSALATGMMFARASDDGTAAGFDLDGRVTEEDGADGCGIGDYTAPWGEPGVDNGFARLIPALMLTEAAAVEDLVQMAINMGDLLVMVEMEGIDDYENDDEVTVRVSRALGQPLIGSHGRILGGQTFDRNEALPVSLAESAVLVDNVLTVRGLDLRIPLQIFDADLDLLLQDAMLRLEIHRDGSMTGAFGGAYHYDDLLTALAETAVDNQLLEVTLPNLLERNADMNPDGSGLCRDISVVLEFEAVTAFFFEGEQPGG